ncbi:diguanylate cyclase domain-containing protein [Roseococcus sp.]|uniref:GGDEF domain-containing protein n=1 Tax=Roseococcus sp. TaxID=2109646 RepID=UPI003BAB40C2
MVLDFTSLLVAVGFSAAVLSAVLVAAWRMSRIDRFLLTCALGAVLIAIGVGFSALYIARPAPPFDAMAFALMLTGLATLHGTARQFSSGASPAGAIAAASLATLLVTVPPLLLGYTGLGFFLGYCASAALLGMTALHYWRAREEAPGIVMAIAGLYLAVGLSFLPRAMLVLLEGKLVIPGQPSNWAEDLSMVLVVAAIPGIGAMTMSLSQIRLVRTHRLAALTDPLTGLMNRRALAEARLGGVVAATLFDIDRFKAINDTHGHARGDRVILLFAAALRDGSAAGELAARIGGEEFALIQPLSTPEAARRRAEEVRARFAAMVRESEGLACTASAGLAIGGSADGFEAVLGEADQALYAAKREGRDRLVLAQSPSKSSVER